MRSSLFDTVPWSETLMDSLSSSLPVLFMILNQQRRILYVNDNMLKTIGCKNKEDICMLRPGEALNCEMAHKAPGGCGCSESCPRCGAFKAICDALNGKQSVHECNFRSVDGECADFRVWSSPLRHRGKTYATISMLNIGAEKMKDFLEHSCFSEIQQAASRAASYIKQVDLENSSIEKNEQILDIARRYMYVLLNDLEFAKQLKQAESNTLSISASQNCIGSIIDSVSQQLNSEYPDKSENVKISFECENQRCAVQTDEKLLIRILLNLVYNAMEAEGSSGTVKLRATKNPGGALFEIHNSTVIPPELHNDIFKRAFSTKGKGRGLGTYSAKLFAEKFLNGRVWFTSEIGSGTTFYLYVPNICV